MNVVSNAQMQTAQTQAYMQSIGTSNVQDPNDLTDTIQWN